MDFKREGWWAHLGWQYIGIGLICPAAAHLRYL
jgi:hypothetical protein